MPAFLHLPGEAFGFQEARIHEATVISGRFGHRTTHNLAKRCKPLRLCANAHGGTSLHAIVHSYWTDMRYTRCAFICFMDLDHKKWTGALGYPIQLQCSSVRKASLFQYRYLVHEAQ